MATKRQDEPPLKDSDVLHGTILLPIAAEVTNEAAAATAVPIVQFEYETAKTELATESIDQDAPQAPIVPNYDSLDSRLRAESNKVAIAKRAGLQKSEDEKEKLRNLQNNVYARNYHAAKAVEEAKEKSKERALEGLEIKEDHWVGKEKKLDENSSAKNKAPIKSHKPGYDCADYKISEYSDSGDYEISEYKSVYDS
mmetsp:Transcript_27240/g.41427  ORF Transcript_27240/g.41427 Transcript_27240/m.41427 type:complete len:197 (+) Transcript_27240:459-1049(+)